MSSSRDSSLWRSLAVAFGDGLAFGVGMKLTQTAGTKALAPAAAEPIANAGRLALLEERLRKVERAPLGPGLDQPVIDAIAEAVEKRLQEQAAAIEQRMAEIEARLAAELNGVRDEVHAVAAGAEFRIRETRAEMQNEVQTARRDVAELTAGRRNDASAIAAGIEKLGRRIVELEQVAASGAVSSEHVAAMAEKVDQIGRNLMAGYDSLRAQVADADRKSASAEAAFEAALAAQAENLTESFASVQDALKEDVATLRRRADAAETGVAAAVGQLRGAVETLQNGVELAVENALGAEVESMERRLLAQVTEATSTAAAMVTHDAAAAMERKLEPLAAALAEKDSAIAELRERALRAESQMAGMLESIGQSYLAAARRSAAQAEPSPQEPPAPKPPASETESPAEPAAGAPLFADGRKPGRVWRIPLVSSFVLAIASVALLRLL